MNLPQSILEWIYFFYFGILVCIIQSILQLRFFGRFVGCKSKKRHFVLYFFALFLTSFLELWLPPPLPLTVRMALLFGMGAALLKCAPTLSLLSAIVAETVAFLSYGITASTVFLTAGAVLKTAFGRSVTGGLLLSILWQLFAFTLIIGAYQTILFKFSWQGTLPSRYSVVFFLPVILVLLVEHDILNLIYGNKVIMENARITEPIANHWQLLLIQLFACFSLFSILYACRKLAEDFSNRTRLLLLERETAAQQDYLRESRARYDQTQSFRHDVKNHLLALAGLLEQGELQEAKAYLGKLENRSEALSFLCKTGNNVVDTVLGSKLSAAHQNGIQVECTVRLPSPCAVDDMDLCVLFSNAVDNAIHACINQKDGTRFIRISGTQKGDFFMIEVENSCLPDRPFIKGTGFANMEAVSEKYHGAVTAEKLGTCFRLNVLLVISRPLDVISAKFH